MNLKKFGGFFFMKWWPLIIFWLMFNGKIVNSWQRDTLNRFIYEESTAEIFCYCCLKFSPASSSWYKTKWIHKSEIRTWIYGRACMHIKCVAKKIKGSLLLINLIISCSGTSFDKGQLLWLRMSLFFLWFIFLRIVFFFYELD